MAAAEKSCVLETDPDRETEDARRAASDAYALEMADFLWSQPEIRERMSATFQRVVDHMVAVRFGNTRQ
jgi:hypothetical protein